MPYVPYVPIVVQNNMFKQVLSYLNEPFPQSDEDRIIILNTLLMGIVVALILGSLRPFGFQEVQEGFFLIVLGYGAVTFLTSLVFEMAYKYVFKLERDRPEWTFWKWFVFLMINLLGIAIVNYFYTVTFVGGPKAWWHFWTLVRGTVIIGFFPILLYGAIVMNRRSKYNEKIAAQIEISPPAASVIQEQNIIIPILQSDKTFQVQPSQILCVEAMQNYVQIHYLHEGGIEKKIIRNTIRTLEELFSNGPVQRSHRSFLVNKNRIKGITGNAQGLKLELDPTPDFWVPVSRKYIPQFKNQA